MQTKKPAQQGAISDERTQFINLQSSTIGYLVALFGLFVSHMAAYLFPSLNLVRNLIFLTFFAAMTASVVYSVTRDGHPFLTKRYEKKTNLLAWVLLLVSGLTILLGMFTLVSAMVDKNGIAIESVENSIAFLLFGLMLLSESWIILKKIYQNRREELEETND